MINKNMEKIVFLALVTGRQKKDSILANLLDADVHLINTIYGQGTVNANYLMNTFGLVPEKNKTMIICVTTERKADIVLKMLVDRFNFNTPNTGIAFTVSVDNLTF